MTTAMVDAGFEKEEEILGVFNMTAKDIVTGTKSTMLCVPADLVGEIGSHLESESATDVGDDMVTRVKSAMFPFPSELIAEIGSHLESATDFMNMRLVNKYVCNSLKPVLYRSIADNRTIFPRYESIAHFLSLLNSDSKHVLHKYVRSITLVAEGLRQHEYGYGWAWEQLQDWENVSVTENDMEIIDEINNRHANELSFNESYYNGGGYRTMLGHLLALLPNLRTITVRKLKVGEHVPGWNGSKLLQSLSFFYEGLNTNEIFYGDWNYDTVHKCVTCYTDEYGEEIVEPGAGPQASFIDDLKAAMEISETFAGIEFAV